MNDYVIRISHSIHVVDAQTWDRLLRTQSHPTPFMQHAYLAALQDSNSACPATGWSPHYITLSQGGELAAATVLFVKDHSYGEYVFDWAWARAYQEHGVPYYPKGVVAVPFTPVPGSRLLARDAAARQRLLQSVVALCSQLGLSSLHLLFGADEDLQAAQQAGLMLRQTVQFRIGKGHDFFLDGTRIILLFGLCQRQTLQFFLEQFDRNKVTQPGPIDRVKAEYSPCLQRARDFADHQAEVVHMLEHIAAGNDVEGAFGKR